MARRRAIGPIGQKVIVTKCSIPKETYSVSCLIGLHNERHLFISSKKNSNNQYDFVDFLMEAIENQYLEAGDFLILDNASVHGASDTIDLLHNLLTNFNINLVYLPTYSPELNPVELVFAMVKKHLRDYFDHSFTLLQNIEISFALVQPNNIFNFYKNCLVIN